MRTRHTVLVAAAVGLLLLEWWVYHRRAAR